MNSMLYIVYGIGSDSVGLVGEITTPISQVNGNIVDMRQDVLHGLFTLYMVVDLKRAAVPVEEFSGLLSTITRETGVNLFMEKYTPVLRSAERKNMLVTLVGQDKPGIIAAITEKLGKYNINIETSEVVARENIFLMDLLTDVSNSSLPMENLKAVVREIMQAVRINTMFQSEDVFNKKKKIVLFDVAGSFIDPDTVSEIMKQAGISRDVLSGREGETEIAYMHRTAGYLEGLPLQVIDAVVDSIQISRGTQELLQTLKIMGYKIGLISGGFTFFTDSLRKRLDIDYSFGFEVPVDDDAKTIVGDIPAGLIQGIDREEIIASVMDLEAVSAEDITVISDRGGDYPLTPGIRLEFDMKVILDFMNQHVLSRDALTGLLRSFGIPKV
ncbi:MAG TPA: ACT domain-containing protein [Deltaproteobacteria bacterium]|nr:ACT domain-containing protein [Deltaproteobacteria bacterium]